MKKIFCILFSFLVLLQCSIKTLIVIEYYIDFNYIVANICENRDKPDAHCDGKCYLEKQLAAEEKNENPLPGFANEKSETLYMVNCTATVPAFYEPRLQPEQVYCLRPYYAFPGSVFHPPPAGIVLS